MIDYQLNNRQIFKVAIISVAVTFITILAAQVVYYTLRASHAEVLRQRSVYRVGNRVLQEQGEAISAYGVDEETAQLQIPIERAMDLIVSEHEEQDEQGEDNPDEA